MVNRVMKPFSLIQPPRTAVKVGRLLYSSPCTCTMTCTPSLGLEKSFPVLLAKPYTYYGERT